MVKLRDATICYVTHDLMDMKPALLKKKKSWTLHCLQKVFVHVIFQCNLESELCNQT